MEHLIKYKRYFIIACLVFLAINAFGKYIESQITYRLAGIMAMLSLALYSFTGSFKRVNPEKDKMELFINRGLFVLSLFTLAIWFFIDGV